MSNLSKEELERRAAIHVFNILGEDLQRLHQVYADRENISHPETKAVMLETMNALSDLRLDLEQQSGEETKHKLGLKIADPLNLIIYCTFCADWSVTWNQAAEGLYRVEQYAGLQARHQSEIRRLMKVKD